MLAVIKGLKQKFRLTFRQWGTVQHISLSELSHLVLGDSLSCRQKTDIKSSDSRKPASF